MLDPQRCCGGSVDQQGQGKGVGEAGRRAGVWGGGGERPTLVNYRLRP